MAHAPLRPVPSRPSGPISDADAVRRVSAALPALGESERLALALVALAGRERVEVALRVGVSERELGEVLAGARKELRRTLAPLPGSGWCERAERLISDRLDGALAERDEPRLDVHLRNCARCVEHERKLVSATDALVGSEAPVSAAPVVELAPPPPAPELAPVPAETPAAPPAPAPVPVPQSLRQFAVTASWHFLLVLAVLVAIASFGLALAGLLGAEL